MVRQIQENYENIATRDNCSVITTTSTKRHNLNLDKYTYDCNSKEGIAQILKGNLSSGVIASNPIKTIAPTSIPKSSLRQKIGNTSSYSSHTKVRRFAHMQISIGFKAHITYTETVLLMISFTFRSYEKRSLRNNFRKLRLHRMNESHRENDYLNANSQYETVERFLKLKSGSH